MGYNTDWNGSLELNRKLTRAEQQEWDDIVENRHDSEYGYGDPKREYPSIWCNFEVEGDEFMWNGNEKTYEGYGWILFFLKWTKEKSKDNLLYAEGEMTFQGEDMNDLGRVTVEYDEDEYFVEEEVGDIQINYSQNDIQRFKEGGKLKVGFEDGFYKFNIGWFWNRNEEFIMEALNKIKNESKPGTYDEITDSKEVYNDVKGPFKNIIKDVQQTVDIVFQVTQRGIPVVGLRIKLNYTHKQGGSNGYSLSYVYFLEGPRKNRWVDPTKSYSEVEEFKKGGKLKVKGRSWYEAGGMVKQADKMRRFKNEMDQSIRQSKGEIEESKRNIEKNRQNLIDSADNIKREERSIKENIVGMREDAKEAQEFERRARKYAKGGETIYSDSIIKIVKLDDGKYYQEIVIDRKNKDGVSEPYVKYARVNKEDIPNWGKYAKGGRTYSRENRPSPSDSATLFEPGYRSRGNDGNIWEIRENIKGTHRWVKLKG